MAELSADGRVRPDGDFEGMLNEFIVEGQVLLETVLGRDEGLYSSTVLGQCAHSC